MGWPAATAGKRWEAGFLNDFGPYRDTSGVPCVWEGSEGLGLAGGERLFLGPPVVHKDDAGSGGLLGCGIAGGFGLEGCGVRFGLDGDSGGFTPVFQGVGAGAGVADFVELIEGFVEGTVEGRDAAPEDFQLGVEVP